MCKFRRVAQRFGVHSTDRRNQYAITKMAKPNSKTSKRSDVTSGRTLSKQPTVMTPNVILVMLAAAEVIVVRRDS